MTPFILKATRSFKAGIQCPLLVLIHGLDSTRLTWQNFIARNEDKFNMISFDLRDHGESQSGEDDEFRASALVDDIRFSISQCEFSQLKVPFVLVGHRYKKSRKTELN